jgi:hypothetical protein
VGGDAGGLGGEVGWEGRRGAEEGGAWVRAPEEKRKGGLYEFLMNYMMNPL